MATTVQIDQAGRIVIPKAMRQALELAGGDEVDLIVQGRELRLRAKPSADGLVRRGKLWVKPKTGRALDPADLQSALERVRDYGQRTVK